MMSDPFSLEGKKIMITGASSGIGKEIARFFSQQGASLILVGRNERSLLEVLNTLENKERHIIDSYDLSNIDEIPVWLKQIRTRVDAPLNGIVHSAGVHNTTPLRVINQKNIDSVMSINLYAGLSLLRGCSNRNIFAPNGSFIFISSVMGLVGQAGVAAYSASKGAIVSAVKSAALELAGTGTRVNCICPGMVDTNMADELFSSVSQDNKIEIVNKHPLGIGKAEDVAYAACYLASNASKWVTGTSLVVDGGYTCH